VGSDSGAPITGGKGGSGGGSAGHSGASAGGAPDGDASTDSGGTTGSLEPDFPRGICRPHGPALSNVAGARVVAESGDIYDIQSIAMRAGTLYWVLQGTGIQRLLPGAAAPEAVVDAHLAWEVFVTDSYVYWIAGNERTLMRASLATLPSTPEQVLLEVDETGLAVDETNIFFTRRSTGDIYKLPFAEAAPGAVPTVLVPTVGPGRMAPSGGDLFYTSYQSVYRVPIGGGAPAYVSVAGALGDITVSDGFLYLVADDTLIKQPVTAPPGGTNWTRLAIGNPISATSMYNQGLEQPGVDGDRVYYREENGAIAWVKTDGSDCRILANVPSRNGYGNKEWVMDATYVYVIEDDIRIVAIPK
jgi:hypothetical protein